MTRDTRISKALLSLAFMLLALFAFLPASAESPLMLVLTALTLALSLRGFARAYTGNPALLGKGKK